MELKQLISTQKLKLWKEWRLLIDITYHDIENMRKMAVDLISDKHNEVGDTID